MGIKEDLDSLLITTRTAYMLLLGFSLILVLSGFLIYLYGDPLVMLALSLVTSSFLPFSIARGIRKEMSQFWQDPVDAQVAATANTQMIQKLAFTKYIELLIFLIGLILLLLYITLNIDLRFVGIPICITAGLTYLISLSFDFKLSIIDHRLNNHLQ